MKLRCFLLAVLTLPAVLRAGNPIVENKGLCDPLVRIYDDRAWLYATHDSSPGNQDFHMTDWWVWSSADLVNWQFEGLIRPEDTYHGKLLTNAGPRMPSGITAGIIFISPGSSAYFRNSLLAYVHYRDNGEIEPVTLDRLGVGEYDAMAPRIEAENYFSMTDGRPAQSAGGGFEVRGLHDGSRLDYPNVRYLHTRTLLSLRAACGNPAGGRIEVYGGNRHLGSCDVPPTGGLDTFRVVSCLLKNDADLRDISLRFDRGGPGEWCRLDWFSFTPPKP